MTDPVWQVTPVAHGWLGSVAAQCWTCNREVAGSTPGRRIVE